MKKNLLQRLATFLLCGIVGVGVSASMLAGGLKKFKEWERSPQAYFLTKAERVAWAAIQTDGKAEKFIAAYLAQRGEKFRTELDQRIAMADKYLSFGKRKGSETLRGKVVILLGPPSKIERKDKTELGRLQEPEVGDTYSNVGPGGGSTHIRIAPTIFTFTYEEAQLPKILNPKRLVLRIEQDPSSGKEKIPDEKEAQLFEEITETLAQASALSATGVTPPAAPSN